MFSIFKKNSNSDIIKLQNLCGKYSIADVYDIFYCFRIILGRDPNPEEINGHLGVGLGKPLDNVVKSYLNSLEFNKRNLLENKNLNNVKIANYDGIILYVDMDDPNIGPAIVDGSFEKDIVEFFKANLKQDMTFLDIGANIGLYTFLGSNIVGQNGKVFSVEPNLNNVKLITMTIYENLIKNIKLLPVAASDDNAYMLLNSSYSNGTTTKNIENKNMIINSTIVPSVKLDDVIKERVDFIKIDIEGAEYIALNGLKQILSSYKPTIISEFSPNSMPGIASITGIDYLNFLRKFDYKIFVINNQSIISADNLSNENIMNVFNQSKVDHIDICATNY